MALTIEMPPQMVEEMRGYAVLDGMSIEQMCLDCIALEMKRRRNAQLALGELDDLAARTSMRRTEPYVFNRADAYEENGEDILDKLSGAARGVQIEDDHGILARAEMEKYERISK